MKPDVSALVMLMLGTLLLTGTRTLAAPHPPKTLRDPKGCHLAPFQSLSPEELQAFRRAKDALEDTLLQKAWNCNTRLFPRNRDLRQLQVWERPVALEAELALTLQVLGAVTEPSLESVLDRPLHTLHHIHSKVQACVHPQSTGSAQPRGRLQRWLQRLQEAPHKESQSCLEASVTLNLIRLLIWDLRCVARGALCV
ncbi:interferon lambda-2-like [Sorex fumeus]|uniref:interferon lambda-2-like n=1 Tax=Sorex fumeus TaxID=62283 RepID=UPI0024AD61CD|nr:interferon lambda-2-like [Sorex fumeus]